MNPVRDTWSNPFEEHGIQACLLDTSMETQAVGSVSLGKGRRSLWAAEPEPWCNTAESVPGSSWREGQTGSRSALQVGLEGPSGSWNGLNRQGSWVCSDVEQKGLGLQGLPNVLLNKFNILQQHSAFLKDLLVLKLQVLAQAVPLPRMTSSSLIRNTPAHSPRPNSKVSSSSEPFPVLWGDCCLMTPVFS